MVSKNKYDVPGIIPGIKYLSTHVIPAQAGIQEGERKNFWIPACAGMTKGTRE